MSKLSQLKQEAYQAGKKRDWGRAVMLYEQLLELDKNNPTVINELGDLCLKAGETSRAVRHFLNAAARYRTNGLLNNAVAIYKKILRYEDKNLNAHWYLSETRAKQGLAVEGENHGLKFLDSSDSVSGDLKEIFLKRCHQLFELFPDSKPILDRLVQIFRMWSLNLETGRAECLLACMQWDAGQQDEAKAQIDAVLTKVPELLNYPEFNKWNQRVNPSAQTGPAFSDFGEVDLSGGGDASPTGPASDLSNPPVQERGPLDGATVDAELEADLDAMVGETPDRAPEPDALVLDAPAAGPNDIMSQASPAGKELDDDGCFSIDMDDDEGLEDLIDEASAGLKTPEPQEEILVDVPTASDGPAEAGDSVDLLSQILAEDGGVELGDDSSQLATITSEIGSVVGGDEGDDDAGRLYEMGMVYLEMGLFDKACDSFKHAAEDQEYAIRAYEMWGITLQRANRTEEAIEILNQGLAMSEEGSKEHFGLQYHLARAHEQSGETEKAIAAYQVIRKAEPTFLDVGRRLNQLTKV